MRSLSRRSRNKLIANDFPNFEIGDFVLVAVIDPISKLSARWTGPWKVVRTENDWVYVVEHLLSKKEKTVHIQRLRFYSDKHLNIDVNLKETLLHNSPVDEYVVKGIVGHRYDAQQNLELQIQWLGFETHEATWEPYDRLVHDIPAMVQRYMEREQLQVPEEA